MINLWIKFRLRNITNKRIELWTKRNLVKHMIQNGLYFAHVPEDIKVMYRNGLINAIDRAITTKQIELVIKTLYKVHGFKRYPFGDALFYRTKTDTI